MLFHSWLRFLQTVATRRGAKGERGQTSHSRPAARCRPRLEMLEDRTAPAVLTVNTAADSAVGGDGYLSLREAIAIVNSPTKPGGLTDVNGQISGTLHDGSPDTIRFDPASVSGPIVLGEEGLMLHRLPSSTARITIDGGPDGVTVDGHHAVGIFGVELSVEVAFKGLTLINGMWSTMDHNFDTLEPGGAIYNYGGTVTISDCTLSGNTGGGGTNGRMGWEEPGIPGGGAIFNFGGTLTITRSELNGNSVISRGEEVAGGAIDNIEGTVTINDSILSDNTSDQLGGAIATFGGTLTMTNCTVNGNSAFHYGGGMYVDPAVVTIIGTTFSGNSAPSGADLYNLDGNVALIGNVITNVYNSVGTVTDPINDLIAHVAALNLNSGVRNSLTSKLQAARQSLANANTTAAVNQLSAFINQLNALVNSHRLGEIPADSLINEVNNLIELID